MRYKILDIALIADKSLDVYAASVMGNGVGQSEHRRSACTKASVMKTFEKVFSEVMDSYSKQYDVTFVVVPCFPMMRMNGVCSIITRFMCMNPKYLYDNGISSAQFIEYFEKFIQQKCDGSRTELYDGKVVILKEKMLLANDWKRLLVDKYGTSLVDWSVSEPFTSNPGFIKTYEDDLSVYGKLDELSEFNAKQLIS